MEVNVSATCQNCGKPVRIGAKFCGSCGAEIPGTTPLSQVNIPQQAPAPQAEVPQPVASQPEATPAPASTNGVVCPHCHKVVREGAKFCNFCGKPLAPAVVSGVPPVPQPAQGEVPVVETIPPAGIPPVPPPPPGGKPPRKKKGGKKGWIVLLVLVLLVLCAAAVLVALYFTDVLPKDKIDEFLGRFAKGTPTVEVTETPEITETPEVTETEEATPTETLEPTLTPIPTIVATEEPITELFKDEFSTDLEMWTLWGPSLAVLDETTGICTLSSTQPDDSGVTTKESISLPEDSTIEFTATLLETAPNNVLEIDWATTETAISEKQPASGIHIELSVEKQTLVVNNTDGSEMANCSILKAIDTDPHTYSIEISSEAVELSMDKGEGICVVEMAPPDMDQPGWLTFSGYGLLDSVAIIEK
jgi:RNA polymerase subunit RPABC4/transcription elongation factor Spt4